MIKLSKEVIPAVLEEHAEVWTAEYLAIVNAGDPVPDALAGRYRGGEIKNALRGETCDKCAYCESKIRHVAPEHVEHILPKSARPDLILSWPNLTLACPQCNFNKGSYYSEAEPLLNPYVDDPESHLLFFGPLVLGRPGSGMGSRTVLRLDLSRPDLVERKKERVERLQHLVDLWLGEDGPERKSLLQSELEKEAAASSEYAAMVRHYLRAVGVPLES